MSEIYKLLENYKFRVEYFGGLLHDKNKKTNYELNRTGTFILELCKKGLPLTSILDYVEKYFSASPKNLQKAKEFIEDASPRRILKRCKKIMKNMNLKILYKRK